MFIWQCNKCGYTIRVNNPKDIIKFIEPDGKCPHCGAPHTEFKLLHTEKNLATA